MLIEAAFMHDLIELIIIMMLVGGAVSIWSDPEGAAIVASARRRPCSASRPMSAAACIMASRKKNT